MSTEHDGLARKCGIPACKASIGARTERLLPLHAYPWKILAKPTQMKAEQIAAPNIAPLTLARCG